MGQAVIGALRVVLGMDTATFLRGSTVAQREMAKLGKSIEQIGDKVTRIGKSMSTGITAPILAAGAGVLKFAGDFEASMNRVQISTQASAAEMKAMNDLALDLGKSTVFSASEASDAMDELAKSGLDAKTILGGAAKATTDLAAAAGTKLDPAAHAITDTMANFGKTTADLPNVVNQITGAVNQSKFDFDDFRLAMGSAGGVAGKVGVSFEDFATVLAATSSSFSSGEDAGTSFKSVLLSIGSPSKKAAAAMKEFGLEFFDATGKMKSMSEIAGILQQKLGGLSDEKKLSAIGDIFGSDGGRTVLALMQLGSQGLDDIAGKIAKVDAAAQSAQRMQGFNAQLEQLKGSVETLAIKIGQSGLLAQATSLVEGLGSLADRLSTVDPATLKFGVTIAGLAAVVGPIVVVLGTFISSLGTIIAVIARLGPIFTTVIPLIAAVGRALIGLAIAGGPLTLIAAAVTAAYVVWQNWDKIGPILARLYTAVKTYLVDKLTGLFTYVTDKVKSVGDAFYTLWDRVVGHSYVPDLVDGIELHFGRLQKAMVDPTTTATQTAGDRFRQLAADAQTIIDRLFPLQAALRQLHDEKKKLDDAFAKGLLSKDELDKAQVALMREGLPDAEPVKLALSAPAEINTDGLGDDLKAVVPQLRPTLSEAFRQTLGDGVRAAMNGDLKGFARSWFQEQAANGLEKAIDSLASVVQRLFANVKIGGSSGGGLFGTIGKALGLASAAGGNGISAGLASAGGTIDVSSSLAGNISALNASIPRFAKGGSFRVGGQGGIDRNLMMMRLSRGERVDITPANDRGQDRGGDTHNYFSGNLMTPEFWAQIQAGDDGAAMRGAVGGDRLARSNVARSRKRTMR